MLTCSLHVHAVISWRWGKFVFLIAISGSFSMDFRLCLPIPGKKIWKYTGTRLSSCWVFGPRSHLPQRESRFWKAPPCLSLGKCGGIKTHTFRAWRMFYLFYTRGPKPEENKRLLFIVQTCKRLRSQTTTPNVRPVKSSSFYKYLQASSSLWD